MTTIAFVNQKGGCGKSTAAVHCAAWLHRQGRSVALVDADAQRSSSMWLHRTDLPVTCECCTDADDLLNLTLDLNERFDDVICDGAGGLTETTRAIALAADVVAVPVQPSSLDVSSATETVKILLTAQRVRGGAPQAAIFLSRSVKATRLAQEARELLERGKLPLLSSTIWQRQVIADVPGQGATVWDLSGSAAADAGADYDRLFQELCQLLN